MVWISDVAGVTPPPYDDGEHWSLGRFPLSRFPLGRFPQAQYP